MPNAQVDLFSAPEAPPEDVTEAPTAADEAVTSESQGTLWNLDELTFWYSEWVNMPAFVQNDESSFDSIVVHFRNADDRRAFLAMMGERLDRRKSIWYPKMEYLSQSKRSAGATVVAPGRYPIYVISKGRWDSRLTVKALEKLGIKHHVVVEPSERDQYAAVVDPSSLLVLPFSDLGQGSIPARNWVWEHAGAAGAERHWILDDNLDGFYKLNNNLKTKVVDENPFVQIENFVDRFTNVAVSGMNYEFFACRREKQPPFYINTRVYSCILIQNAIPYRWRGRYNEDTDLSIRALKDGWVTVLFNTYLCKKMPTMSMTGGNTEALYQGDGRREMAESLREQHPDVVTVTQKWGRYQHQVDYRPFRRNRLIRKAEVAA